MDIQRGTYTYTDPGGQKLHVPIERVSAFSQLHKGNHIAIKRLKGCYWHHAIVEDVDTERGIINVIEYSNFVEEFLQEISDLRSPGKAKVMRGKYRLKDGLYVIKHDKCLSAEDVVNRARSELGKTEYNLFCNNCEHFALWCKTGIWSSEQVKNMEEMVKKTAKETGKHLVVELLVETGEKIVMTVRATLNGAEKEAWRVFHFPGAQTEAMQWVLKEVAQIVAEPVVTQYSAKGGQNMLLYGAQMALGLCFPSLSKCGQAMMLNGGEIALEQLLFQSISKGVQWSVERVAQIAAEQAVSKGVQWVLKKVAQMAAEQTSTTTRTFAGRALLGGAARGALIEGAIGLWDIYWAYEDLKVGKISKKEFYDASGERFLGGVGGVIGATAGRAVGQLVPFPVVGGIVGSVIGELVGRLCGNLAWNAKTILGL